MKIIFQKTAGLLSIVTAISSLNLNAQVRPTETLPPAQCIRLATSISTPYSNGTFFPFVDFFKLNNGWQSNNSSRTFDDNGYISSNANGAFTQINLKEVPDGTEIVVMWDGAPEDITKAAINLINGSSGSNTIIQNAQGGRMTITKNFDIATLTITNSQNTTDPANPKHIRNIRMVRKGFETTYQNEPFTPEFLEQSKDLEIIKVNPALSSMLEENINRGWEYRTKPSSFSQTVSISPTNKSMLMADVAYEYTIQLANIHKKDCWVNIPYNADSMYVVKMAELFKQQLNSNSKVYVETSYEMWNITAINKAYSHFLALNGNDVNKTHEYIVKLIKRNWRIWKTTLGSRVHKVLGVQTGFTPFGDNKFYFTVSNYQGEDKFDVLAVTSFINLGNKKEEAINLGNSITPEKLNELALEAWKNGSSWISKISGVEFGGIKQYSRAAKANNAKLFVYGMGLEYSDDFFNPLPNTDKAAMDKASLKPLFTAVLDTLKNLGVEIATYENLNGEKNNSNYALLGGTFNPNIFIDSKYSVGAKYTVLEEYLKAQNCVPPTSIFDRSSSSESMLTVYPNPTSGSFSVIAKDNFGSNKINIECFNSLGNKVYESIVNPGTDIDALQGLPKGIYQIRASVNGKNYIQKIIKE